MKNQDIKIGMKVVPLQKTRGWQKLDASKHYKKMKEINQPFLYVIDSEDDLWMLSYRNDTNSGDYFNACDFEPYIEKKSITKNIKHIITGNKTIVVIQNEDGTYLKGESKCNPQDEFNEYEGLRIAYCRAIGKEPFEKSAIVQDIDGNKKQIIDNRVKVNKDLWRLFLKGLICIHCETKQNAIKLLSYCKRQGIRWRRGAIINPYNNHWGTFTYNTCYSFSAVGLMYDVKFNYLPKQIINYNTIFTNNNIRTLSPFTNEELLEELKLRLSKQN